MMAKPKHLSVEIVTDNHTSGKISITQLVSVAEQNGLSNTWSKPQNLCQHACVSTLHANWCYMYLQTFILTSFKNIFHVPDRVRVHVYVIISSSLKPYQNFGPDLSPACLLMFSVVIHDQETDTFKTDHGYSIRSRASCQWSWRVKIYISYEKLSNSKYITALVAVCRNIIFNNERIIWGKHFASYYQDLFSNLYNMYQSFRIGHCLEILFFARTWR